MLNRTLPLLASLGIIFSCSPQKPSDDLQKLTDSLRVEIKKRDSVIIKLQKSVSDITLEAATQHDLYQQERDRNQQNKK
jgi:hypothetical protein